MGGKSASHGLAGTGRTIRRWLRVHVLRPRSVGVLFILTLVLGTAGFQSARLKSDIVDSVYRSVQLFGLGYNGLDAAELDPHSSAAGDGENWLIETARFSGALVLGSGVIALLASLLRDFGRLQWQTGRSGRSRRVVLLGFGAVNTALARELARHGTPLTVVSAAFSEADRQMAREYGLLLVTGDLTDTATLRRARIGLARRIVVAAGDDVLNVEIGTVAAGFAETAQAAMSSIRNQDRRTGRPAGQRRYGCDENDDPVVLVHLSRTRTLADLTEARDIAYASGAAAGFFSVKNEAARKLVREARLTRLACEKGQDRVHVVMAGMGDQGEALLTEIYLNAFGAAVVDGKRDVLKPPRFTIIDTDASTSVHDRLKAHRPRLFDDTIPAEARPEFEFINADAMEICFDTNDRLNAIEDHCPVTAWVFVCGRDNVNLAAGFRLEMAMHQRNRDPAPVFIRLWNADIATDDSEADIAIEKRNPLLATQVFGSMSTVMPQSSFLANVSCDARQRAAGRDDQERLAMLLHNYYVGDIQALAALGVGSAPDAAALSAATDRYMADWRALPTNVRETNRRVIRHAASKLRDIGFDWPHAADALLPEIERQTAEWMRAMIAVREAPGALPDLGQNGAAWLTAIGIAGDPQDDATRREAARQIEALAKSEHGRWMADRALDGWQYGEERDNRRRLHTTMIDYAKLGHEAQLDLTAVRMLLDCLSSDADGGGRPRARLRRIVETGLEAVFAGNAPAGEALAEATELRIVIGETVGFDGTVQTESADRLKRLVADWLDKAALACQLHFVLEMPVEPGHRTSPAASGRVHLGAVLGDIAGTDAITQGGVAVDITRAYRRIG